MLETTAEVRPVSQIVMREAFVALYKPGDALKPTGPGDRFRQSVRLSWRAQALRALRRTGEAAALRQVGIRMRAVARVLTGPRGTPVQETRPSWRPCVGP